MAGQANLVHRLLTRRNLILAVLLGGAAYLALDVTRRMRAVDVDTETIRGIVASEELILELTPRLKRLSRSVLNLRLPDDEGRRLFSGQVSAVDLMPAGPPTAAPSGRAELAGPRNWPVEPAEQNRSLADIDLWRPLLDGVDYFEHAKFYFVRGEFAGEDLSRFDSIVGFRGLARLASGQWCGVAAKLHVRWRRAGEEASSGGSDWRITRWHLDQLETTVADQLMFAEVLDRALPDADQLRRVRTSEHYQQVLDYYRQGAGRLPSDYFSPISANLKPGLAVVDVDGDGLDDLYVMVRSGRNQLLRNRGDGTFEEVADQWNLDVKDDTTCALFADFDNDGDPDALLGRSLQRSIYLENTGRRFVARGNALRSAKWPYLVVSMSAADYNGDGLLDVYLSTYRPAVFENLSGSGTLFGSADQDERKNWPARFLPPDQADELRRRTPQVHGRDDRYMSVLDQAGPPNVLLVNRGGGQFEVSPHGGPLAVWRNTLQATWSDFDRDGDADLYVANDWAPDHLFRNDGEAGFVDVTQTAGTTAFGFAMGASWGDYDQDGRPDLYVSNMYSKAGRRITAQIGGLDPTYARSAEGNYLYRNLGGRFELASGLERPALTVAQAGWSWGGQFVDLDNDGFLDLYVLSGYFTAPPEFASQVDL